MRKVREGLLVSLPEEVHWHTIQGGYIAKNGDYVISAGTRHRYLKYE
jgi:hypothetical protein